MEESTWLSRISGWVNRIYERRIKAASEVSEYGADHGHHHHAHSDHLELADVEEEAEEAEIVNVPRGTRVGSSHH